MKITKIKIDIEYIDDNGKEQSMVLLDSPVEYCHYKVDFGIGTEYDSICGPPRHFHTGVNSLKLDYKIKPKNKNANTNLYKSIAG